MDTLDKLHQLRKLYLTWDPADSIEFDLIHVSKLHLDTLLEYYPSINTSITDVTFSDLVNVITRCNKALSVLTNEQGFSVSITDDL